MAAAIPAIITALAAGGQMVAANQQSQDAKGKASEMQAEQKQAQDQLLADKPAAEKAPNTVNKTPTGPGKLGRAGTILTAPTTPEEAPTQRKTLLGL